MSNKTGHVDTWVVECAHDIVEALLRVELKKLIRSAKFEGGLTPRGLPVVSKLPAGVLANQFDSCQGSRLESTATFVPPSVLCYVESRLPPVCWSYFWGTNEMDRTQVLLNSIGNENV